MTSRVVAHKDYLVRGGGERLVEHLARGFDAPLFIGGSHGDVDLEYDDTREIAASRWQRAFIDHGGFPRALAYLVAWQNEERLAEYDTVITSGNEPLWYVPEPRQTVVAYCHSPPRLMYDLNHDSSSGMLGTVIRSVKRVGFQHNVPRPDAWVANSDGVKRRMERYWGLRHREIEVVYPPTDVESYGDWIAPTEDFYLYLGRLVGHKRVDEAIRAVNDRDGATLKVAGRGSAFDDLAELAGPDVELLGYVSEDRKRELLSAAKALVMPARAEDFGMVTVEAMASGTPVIGVNEGFTGELIEHYKNGLLYDRGRLDWALDRFEYWHDPMEWTPEGIETFADQFSIERFQDEMRTVVERAERESAVETSIEYP